MILYYSGCDPEIYGDDARDVLVSYYDRHPDKDLADNSEPDETDSWEFPMVKVKSQKITKKYAVYNGDCCEVLPGIPADSVGLSIFSPPFADLYSYSDSVQDLGNCPDYKGFFTHFDFLAKELFRVTMPGRVVCVHCMDLPLHKNKGEEIGLRDFSGDLIQLFQKTGFVFHSRHCIWKDPLVAATRTKAIGLAHKQLIKDSSISRTGIPDYLLAFRKPGENRKFIGHPDGLTEYCGERAVPRDLDRFIGYKGDQKLNKRSHWIWQQYASPVWFDIRQTRVLPYRGGRDKDDERHICLAKWSRVLTKERGYIPIQQVVVGEHTLTHKGRWRPILAVQRIGDRPTVIVRAQGVPNLILTPDHKLWSRKSDWVRQREGAERVEPTWIEAQNCLGGYLNLKVPKEESCENTNLDHWWLTGRWLADGHWDYRRSAHISCGYHELESLIAKMGDYAGFVHDTGTSYQIRIADRNGDVRNILSRCGVGASGKHLPPEAFTLPFDQAKALVDGYLSGDGHYLKSRDRWMASSVSRSLLLELSLLIQRVYGSITSVYAGRGKRKDTIQGREVNCKQDWIMSFDLPQIERNKKQFILDDGAWKKVRSVEDVGIREVWNIRVAEDESFTAEGCVVKNCPLQLDVIERCLVLWSAKGDTVLTPFMGVGSEVYCAVKHGRRAVGVELKTRYYRQALRNLNSITVAGATPTLSGG